MKSDKACVSGSNEICNFRKREGEGQNKPAAGVEKKINQETKRSILMPWIYRK